MRNDPPAVRAKPIDRDLVWVKERALGQDVPQLLAFFSENVRRHVVIIKLKERARLSVTRIDGGCSRSANARARGLGKISRAPGARRGATSSANRSFATACK